MITSHLPALAVIIPLLASPFMSVIRSSKIQWCIFALVGISILTAATILLGQVKSSGELFYHFGDWWAPIGIAYRLDLINTIILAVLGVITLLCMLQLINEVSLKSLRREYIPLLSLLLTGLIGMLCSDDLFNIYVFIEISSLASYGLVALGNKRSSAFVAFNYLIYGTTGATFYLLGVGILYSFTGTLNASNLADLLPNLASLPIVQLGIALIIVGLGLKAAIFPFSSWLLGVYQASPTSTTILFAGISSKIYIYLILRTLTYYWPYNINFSGLVTIEELLKMAAIAMVIYGTWHALRTKILMRILAASSLTNLGYMLWCLAANNASYFQTALTIIVYHGVLKAASVSLIGRLEAWNVHTLTSISKTNIPVTLKYSAIITLLALAGLPLTGGFIYKFMLLRSLVENQDWAVLVLMLSTFLFSMLYLGRIILTLYHAPAKTIALKNLGINLKAMEYTVPAALVLVLGIISSKILPIIQQATEQLWP